MSTYAYLKKLISDELSALGGFISELRLVFVALAVGFCGLIYYLDPFPAKEIYLATSSQNSDWYHFGENLEPNLVKKDIDIHNIPTQGAVENFQLLTNPDSKVNAAYVYGGALSKEDAQQIFSLGSLTYEPIWIFYDQKKLGKINNLKDLSKLRVGIGPEKSGSYILSKNLFALNNIEIDRLQNFKSDIFSVNLKKLLRGELDAFIQVSTINDPGVQELLKAPGISLLNFKNAEAYEKNVNYLNAVTLPAGSIDIAKNLPPEDIHLVATTMSMVVNKKMHPDVQLALLMSIKERLQVTNNLFFAKRNEFPAYLDARIPLSPVVVNYNTFGPPQLLRYLPFWPGLFLSRFWLVILTLGAFIYPLSKLNFAPRKARYDFKKYPGYLALLKIDQKITLETPSQEDLASLLHELNEINRHASEYDVPTGMEKEYFRFISYLNQTSQKITNMM